MLKERKCDSKTITVGDLGAQEDVLHLNISYEHTFTSLDPLQALIIYPSTWIPHHHPSLETTIELTSDPQGNEHRQTAAILSGNHVGEEKKKEVGE